MSQFLKYRHGILTVNTSNVPLFLSNFFLGFQALSWGVTQKVFSLHIIQKIIGFEYFDFVSENKSDASM
jgi:hypothetical protein